MSCDERASSASVASALETHVQPRSLPAVSGALPLVGCGMSVPLSGPEAWAETRRHKRLVALCKRTGVDPPAPPQVHRERAAGSLLASCTGCTDGSCKDCVRREKKRSQMQKKRREEEEQRWQQQERKRERKREPPATPGSAGVVAVAGQLLLGAAAQSVLPPPTAMRFFRRCTTRLATGLSRLLTASRQTRRQVLPPPSH